MKIYAEGMDLVNRKNWIGLVGSENPTEKEREMAFEFAKYLVGKGKIVVSVFGKGINEAAHKGAIAGKGKTVTIFNMSEEEASKFAEDQELIENIKQNGAVIFAYENPATQPPENGLKQSYKRVVEANQLLGYLCHNIVVVKEKDEPIDGDVKWAASYASEVGKRVTRMNSTGQFVESPKFERERIWWNAELQIPKI